jgi:hypothetical protein
MIMEIGAQVSDFLCCSTSAVDIRGLKPNPARKAKLSNVVRLYGRKSTNSLKPVNLLINARSRPINITSFVR